MRKGETRDTRCKISDGTYKAKSIVFNEDQPFKTFRELGNCGACTMACSSIAGFFGQGSLRSLCDMEMTAAN